MEHDLNLLFRTAAKNAAGSWTSALEPEDVEQELWTWYLAGKGTPQMLGKLSFIDAVKYATSHAHKILSADVKASYIASGAALYSSDAVKATLKGESAHEDLQRILPIAMKSLERRHIGYAEAIRSRYQDGLIPDENRYKQLLKHAHIALTEEVNKVNRTELAAYDKHEARLQRQIDPDRRGKSGGVSNPTADIALLLIDHPAERAAFYEEGFSPRFVKSEPSAATEWNIFDHEFQGMERLALYRAMVYPDLYPKERTEGCWE